MDGVNILATITSDTVNSSFFLFLVGIVVCTVVGVLIWIDEGFVLSGHLFMCAAILCFIGLFVFSIEKEVTYKATIDDTVPLKAIEEKYIIVDRTDELYTLKLKENENEQDRKN